MNTVNGVMTVTENNSLRMLQYIYEKSKLVERSGRKATNLSLPCKGGYGSRVAMEKSTVVMLILLAKSIQSGGYYEVSIVFP